MQQPKQVRDREGKRTVGCVRAHRAVRALCGGLVLALVVWLGSGTGGYAQSQQGPTSGGSSSQSSSARGTFGHSSMSPIGPDEDYDPVMTERRMRALNAERQKQMVSDANKLLKLAKELNEEVATAKNEAFTSDQLRKIAEIEKLAKNVRERMTAGTSETPSLLATPPMVFPNH
jgi:hypothetical protein